MGVGVKGCVSKLLGGGTGFSLIGDWGQGEAINPLTKFGLGVNNCFGRKFLKGLGRSDYWKAFCGGRNPRELGVAFGVFKPKGPVKAPFKVGEGGLARRLPQFLGFLLGCHWSGSGSII